MLSLTPGIKSTSDHSVKNYAQPTFANRMRNKSYVAGSVALVHDSSDSVVGLKIDKNANRRILGRNRNQSINTISGTAFDKKQYYTQESSDHKMKKQLFRNS
jgi:hypothetical protein